MKITAIKLKNFKRFTELVIKDIPETAKLVVIVGPNGCGKSSLFDALLQWYHTRVGFGANQDFSYYRKDEHAPFAWGAEDNVSVSLAKGAVPTKGSLYVRTAYRNDPDFSISGISRPDAPAESIRFHRVIDNDQTVAQNYQRLVYDTMAGVYDSGNDAKTVRTLRDELIGQIRQSMLTVFGDLQLQNISDPLGSGAFFFEKGAAKSYHYKNLSGGEKAAFDLLLDLHVKRKFFTDAVYCVDELETHLHTRVQGRLIREMVNILPEESQLWATTHSLGVLRAAQQMELDDPGSVCVIDFDGIDPDIPREIVPSSLGRVSWEKLLSITLDDFSNRVTPEVIVVCEGSSVGSRRKDFDAEIYNRILGSRMADVLFVSGGSAAQAAATGVSIRDTLAKIMPAARIVVLIDRDDKSDREVEQFEVDGSLVLGLRNLESYLFADDVIEALVHREGKHHLLGDALKIKADAIAASVARGNPPDDLKSAGGGIYVGLKRLLAMNRCGNNTDTFMRDTLALLVKPGMSTFEDLRRAILQRL